MMGICITYSDCCTLFKENVCTLFVVKKRVEKLFISRKKTGYLIHRNDGIKYLQRFVGKVDFMENEFL